jgi:hypothetical protein
VKEGEEAGAQVLAEVYATQELGVRPPILLSLILFKAVDELQVLPLPPRSFPC